VEIISYDMSGIRVLRFRGRLEEADVAGFMRQVYPDLLGRPGVFLLNLDQMEQVSAYGLAVLHDLLRKLGREGSPVGLVVAGPLAQDWETLMGEGQVGIYPTEMAGIQGMVSLQTRPGKRSGTGLLDPDCHGS
jgi:hypothetical protein